MKRHLKPKALKKGSTIGIVAASSPFLKSSFLRGVKILETLGFKVKYGKKIFSKKGYLAGPDKERAREFNKMLADKDIDAIMFARGGYGVQRILGDIKFELLSKKPKLIIGYSDLTALSAYITSHLRITCVHGPVVTGLEALESEKVKALFKIVTAKKPLGQIEAGKLRVIKKGQAQGVFLGGCLTLISTNIGTPYHLITKDSILFLEDTGERLYRYDRMLTQLKNSGALENVRGIVFGPLGLEPSETNPDSLWEMIADVMRDFKGPIVYGLKSGHTEPFFSLPLGVQCTLTAANSEDGKESVELVFEESALK